MHLVRHRAEEALARRGIKAFDELKAAENHPDVEIAARASYLTQLIEVPWVGADDAEDVGKILRGYGEVSPADRLKRIRTLASLANDAGLGALCRIARYESSPLLSRTAALAVLGRRPASPRTADQASDRAVQLADVVPRHLGRSARPAARWLRALLSAQRDPTAGLQRWLELQQEEQRLLVEHPDRSRVEFVVALMRRRVELLRSLGRRAEAVAVMMQMAEMEPAASDTLVELVQWLVKDGAWSDIDDVGRRFTDRFVNQSLLRYTLAQARSAQGRTQLAERLAAQAFLLDQGDAEQHLATAIELEKQGLSPWAEREYRYVMQLGSTPSENLLWASNRLSLMLHDQGKELQAADVLQAAVTQFDKVLTRERLRPAERPQRTRAPRSPLRARMEYYRAAHYAQQEDWAAQRRYLDRAVGHDPLDADILIAMYRLPDVDQAYRGKTRQRIEKAAAVFRAQIKQSPEDSAPLNQLAWLVCNTEGDFDQAIAASRKSLELVPGSAGYLDTLAHCYYAKGDYASAVRIQSQAAGIEPHTQSILRQLDLFKRALREAQQRQPPVD